MALKSTVLIQRENTEICLQKLLKCKTGEETIVALEEIAQLLFAARDPVAEAAWKAYQLSQTMDEEYVLRVRDDFIRTFRNFISSTDSFVADLEATKPAKPKPRRLWLFVIIGLVAVAICAVIGVALFAVFLAMGGA